MTREERLTKRKEAGKGYIYKPNPYPKDSKEFLEEKYRRSKKSTTSSKTPYAQRVSIMKKLDNEIEAAQKAAKKEKDKK